jgi:DNA-binding HxlR family transcriptional regulator
MQHKSFSTLQCPIARSLERVGERWSILILRDAFQGLTRFDQFQTSLGIAPNILARRLKSLVEAGLLERRRYSAHPPRRISPHRTGPRLPAGDLVAARLGQQASGA